MRQIQFPKYLTQALSLGLERQMASNFSRWARTPKPSLHTPFQLRKNTGTYKSVDDYVSAECEVQAEILREELADSARKMDYMPRDPSDETRTTRDGRTMPPVAKPENYVRIH